MKGQVYEGGVLVPGLIEWPARFPQPRSTTVPAHTSDLLPTLCALVGQPLPNRPLDGIDLLPLLAGSMTQRSGPIHFWAYNTARFDSNQPEPYIVEEYKRARANKYYMTSRLICVNDVYAFDPDAKVDLEQFEDVIGRNFKQPKEGLGLDNSPSAHMWRTILWPTRFL